MEHLVRVQNERDRRTLAWLRAQVGDAAFGVTAPRFSTTQRPAPGAAAEQSPATIRQILLQRAGGGSLRPGSPIAAENPTMHPRSDYDVSVVRSSDA